MEIIEHEGHRVLTSSQLAEHYGTDYKTISHNFTRNKNRYTEGKHYFTLRGAELREFKTIHQIGDQLKHSPLVYLWTDKGALMQAKSLGTDQAWSVYEILVDDYFVKAKKIAKDNDDMANLSPQLQFMIITERRQNELESKQQELQKENEELRNDMRHLSLVVDNEVWLTENQKADIQQAVKSRVGHLKKEAVDAHFQGIYSDLKTFFNVPKYDKIARKDFEQAIEFVKGWFPKKKENLS